MTRSEMVRAVERLSVADGNEAELHELRQQLKMVLPHANISDLIYYPDQERTEEQIVDEALRREQEYVLNSPTSTD